MNEKTNNIITSAMVGIIAYICADIIHEVLGHGSVALFQGNQISLLTSAFFKSTPGSILTDLGGPLSNLIFGFLLFTILKYRQNMLFLTSLLLATIMSYNFFWFSGTILQSGFSKAGDWTFTVALLNIGILSQPFLIIIGIIAYIVSIKLVANRFSNLRFSKITLKQSTYYAYLFGTLAAIVAGLFFAPDRISSSKEGLLEMIASLPVLFMNKRENEKAKLITVKTNWIFYLTVCAAYILFCLSLGKGIY